VYEEHPNSGVQKQKYKVNIMSKSQQHLDHVAEQLTELMETEGMNWTKSWVGQGAPINASTGATYQGINFMWLSMMAKQYEHNEWMTFKQAEAKGFKIKPNKDMPNGKSTAQTIVFFKMMKKGKKYFNDYDKAQMAQGNVPMFPMLKYSKVFNVSQVDGYEPKTTPKSHVSEICKKDTKMIDTYFANTGSVIGLGEPCYIPSIDEIRMPEKEKFDNDVAYYGTLAHEHIHWTGSKNRLKRIKTTSFGTPDYAREELVAEVGASFICAQLGIESTPRADHARYLNGWLKAIKDDSKAMYRAFNQASKAVAYLNDLQEKQDQKVA